MVLRRVSQPDLRWDCKGSTTSPSPSLSPLLSNVSLSPMARQNMSVSSLLNGGMSSDEVSQPTFSSPPSRLSTPPDSGGDARPEVHRQTAVTLPGINHIIEYARSQSEVLTPPTTPGASSIATTIAPVVSRVPIHLPHNQLLPIHHRPLPQITRYYGHGGSKFHSPGESCARIHKPKPRKSPNYPLGHTRNNRKYTAEQVDFICYFHVDKKLNWNEVKEAYGRQFPSEGSRTESGLQGSYYRCNLQVPVTDHNNDLIFRDGVLQVKTLKVREQGGTRVGLLDRYPNRALEYPWVHDEDKRRVWHIGRKHQEQIAREHRRQQARQANAPAFFPSMPLPTVSPPSSISSLSTTSPRL